MVRKALVLISGDTRPAFAIGYDPEENITWDALFAREFENTDSISSMSYTKTIHIKGGKASELKDVEVPLHLRVFDIGENALRMHKKKVSKPVGAAATASAASSAKRARTAAAADDDEELED